MAEYSEDNKFPFHTREQSVAVCNDDHEDLYEMNLILSKLVSRFPDLDPRPFYQEIDRIQTLKDRDKIRSLKQSTDKLLRSIKTCLMDEEFVH